MPWYHRTCKECGEEFDVYLSPSNRRNGNSGEFCSRACYFEYQTAHAHSDAISPEFREEVKQYDNWRCVVCGIRDIDLIAGPMGKNDHGEYLSRKYSFRPEFSSLHVHHRDRDKTNNTLANCVTLCVTCHVRLHRHPEFEESIEPKIHIARASLSND